MIVVMTVIFDSFFIAMHSDHDCVGDDCSICEMMNRCIENLNDTQLLITSGFIIIVIALSAYCVCIDLPLAQKKSLIDLVSLKIRMNN